MGAWLFFLLCAVKGLVPDFGGRGEKLGVFTWYALNFQKVVVICNICKGMCYCLSH